MYNFERPALEIWPDLYFQEIPIPMNFPDPFVEPHHWLFGRHSIDYDGGNNRFNISIYFYNTKRMKNLRDNEDQV